MARYSMYSGEAIQAYHEDFESRARVVRPSIHHHHDQEEAILLRQQREIGANSDHQWPSLASTRNNGNIKC